jgi:Arc/MetJ family transcription regulator
MKTTIDLPEEALAEAIRHTGAKTKTEAVSVAVADYNRRQRLARLAARMCVKGYAHPQGSEPDAGDGLT